MPEPELLQLAVAVGSRNLRFSPRWRRNHHPCQTRQQQFQLLGIPTSVLDTATGAKAGTTLAPAGAVCFRFGAADSAQRLSLSLLQRAQFVGRWRPSFKLQTQTCRRQKVQTLWQYFRIFYASRTSLTQFCAAQIPIGQHHPAHGDILAWSSPGSMLGPENVPLLQTFGQKRKPSSIPTQEFKPGMRRFAKHQTTCPRAASRHRPAAYKPLNPCAGRTVRTATNTRL